MPKYFATDDADDQDDVYPPFEHELGAPNPVCGCVLLGVLVLVVVLCLWLRRLVTP